MVLRAVLEDGEGGTGDSGGYRVGFLPYGLAAFFVVQKVADVKKYIFWKSVDFATDGGDA
jgi:hypothetical protein